MAGGWDGEGGKYSLYTLFHLCESITCSEIKWKEGGREGWKSREREKEAYKEKQTRGNRIQATKKGKLDPILSPKYS